MAAVLAMLAHFLARVRRRASGHCRKAENTLRYRGLWPLLWYLLKSMLSPFGQLALVNLYERNLSDPIPDVHPRVEVEVTLADGADIEELLALAKTKGWPIPRHLEARTGGPAGGGSGAGAIGEGRNEEGIPAQPSERCFVARVGREIVHSSWVREGGAIDYFVEPPIESELRSGEAYFHTAYTSPTWRGKMIHSAVLREKLLYARRAGFRRAYSLVDADNIPSRKGVERLGWHVAARIFFFIDRRRKDAFVWVVNGRTNMLGSSGRRVHLVHYLAALMVLVLTACGGAASGVSAVGSVAGSVGVSVSTAQAGSSGFRAGSFSPLGRVPVDRPSFAPAQLLVKIKRGVPSADVKALTGGLGTEQLRFDFRTGLYLLRITTGEPVEVVVDRFRAHPSVEFAEPNYLWYLDTAEMRPAISAPNDPAYPSQWHYASINLPAAWEITTGSALVVVAVIDTGIVSRHEDLSGVTVAGYDFVEGDTNPEDPGCPDATIPSHGTHLSGTIAALTNNGRGVAGVNWGGVGSAKIMPLRIFTNDGGSCAATTSRIVDAIYYAVSHSARVINMSFGTGYGNFSQAFQDAINYANAAGVIVVASAGNDNRDLDQAPRYPVCYANVLGVAATTISNARAPYSNFGSCVDVVAPGGDLSTDLNGDGNPDGILSTSGTQASPSQYLFMNGTSFAASHVTGLVALLMAKGVTGPSSVQSIIQTSATDLGSPGYDPNFGWGLINAGAALGAPASTNLMQAFTGTSSGSSIILASDMVTTGGSGVFFITNAVPGTRSVFAWQDVNGNGLVDGGDFFGETPGVSVSPGSTTSGVTVAVTRRPAGSPPLSVGR